MHETENVGLLQSALLRVCAVWSGCGSAKMVASLVTLSGHVGCLQLYHAGLEVMALHWLLQMSSAAERVHPVAVSICVFLWT